MALHVSAMPDVDASGVIQARRRGLATRFVAVVIAGPASAQLAALRPLALTPGRSPDLRSPPRVDGLARAPSMSDSAPPTPSVSRAPGSRPQPCKGYGLTGFWDSGPAATL